MLNQNTSFVDNLSNCIQKHTTEIGKEIENDSRKPWISKRLLTSIKEKNNLQPFLKENPQNIQNILRYNSCKNELNKLIKEAKISFFQNKMNIRKNESRALWRNIYVACNRRRPKLDVGSIRFRGQYVRTDKKRIVNAFNTHYSEVRKVLADKI